MVDRFRLCVKAIAAHCIRSIWIACLVLFASACADNDASSKPVHQLSGNTMGTSWSVQLIDTDIQLPLLRQAILTELDRINGLMSTWDPDSQLSQFNASDTAEPVLLHSDTLAVIDAAQQISFLTQGRYDITLGPVIGLWGFGSQPSLNNPSDRQLSEALSASGYRLLVRTGNTVRKRHPQLRVDVSSLAKGFAVDKLGEVLESFDVADYLVEIGGELRARGMSAANRAWKVGIEQPSPEVAAKVDTGVHEDVDEAVLAGLYLQDASVASSGTYRNYREENGKRLSHIIDGLTGKPIEHALVAVSVVHQNTMLADAWATALLVVGEDVAKELIRQQGLAAQLTIRVNDGFMVYRSSAFSSQLVEP